MSEENKRLAKKVGFWVLISVLFWMTLSIIGSATYLFQTVIAMVIFWWIGYVAFRHRKFIAGLMESDQTLVGYFRERRQMNHEYRSIMDHHNRFNNLDNESVRPLDDREDKEWRSIISKMDPID